MIRRFFIKYNAEWSINSWIINLDKKFFTYSHFYFMTDWRLSKRFSAWYGKRIALVVQRTYMLLNNINGIWYGICCTGRTSWKVIPVIANEKLWSSENVASEEIFREISLYVIWVEKVAGLLYVVSYVKHKTSSF